MSYSPLRVMPYVREPGVPAEPQKKDKNLLDYTMEASSNDATYSSLSLILNSYKKKRNSEDQVKSVMTRIMLKLAAENSGDDEEQEGMIAKGFSYMAKRALIQAGKRIVMSVLRPVLSLVFNIIRTIVTFAVRGIVRFIIAPIITGVLGVLIANPLVALAGLALGGAAWWAWNKFFRKDSSPTPDGTVIPQTVTYTPAQTRINPVTGRSTGLVAVPQVYSPVEIATANLKTTKVPKGTKFAGFGTDIDAYIKEASTLYKLPEDVLRGFIKMEDGWTGKMSPTGAIGTGQFILSTWNSLANSPAGKAIGMEVITMGPKGTFRKDSDPRYNMRVNTLATALLARMNADILIRNKIPVTGENLYMMHNIGPGIINVMLGKTVSSATLLAMQQNGMKAGWTAAEFLSWQQGRFNQQYAIANQGKTETAVAATSAKQTAPVVIDPPKKQEVKVAANDSPKPVPLSTPVEEKTLVTKGKSIIAVKG